MFGIAIRNIFVSAHAREVLLQTVIFSVLLLTIYQYLKLHFRLNFRYILIPLFMICCYFFSALYLADDKNINKDKPALIDLLTIARG
jgi:hypothetical protein